MPPGSEDEADLHRIVIHAVMTRRITLMDCSLPCGPAVRTGRDLRLHAAGVELGRQRRKSPFEKDRGGRIISEHSRPPITAGESGGPVYILARIPGYFFSGLEE